ncbi:MAG TPA: hypothetical protein VFU95_01925 [Telluria sp.]|nr:hypothetical protein [Telluria sp.]
MKSLFLRTGAALACALTLASCGGSGGSLLLGGTVYGLTKDGLVLQNNGANDLTVAANATTFYFTNLIGNDTDYNVTIKSSPSSAVCKVNSGGTGRSSTYDVTTVIIVCATNTYNLSGSVSNLTGDGLVLINGQDRVAVPKGATSFTFTTSTTASNGTTTFAGKVGDGSPYGVTVLTQPTGQTCTVTNGTATMGSADVNNVQVNCI